MKTKKEFDKNKLILNDEEINAWLERRLGPGHRFNIEFCKALLNEQMNKVEKLTNEKI